MFGRKFLLLKKKIYELEEDCNNLNLDDDLFFKGNKIDENQFSLNKQNSKSVTFSSQTLQTFSFGDRNPVYNGNRISSDFNQSQQMMSQGVQSQNFTFSNMNVMITSKNQSVPLRNRAELENIFGNCFENESTKVASEYNSQLKYTNTWNIEIFSNIDFQDKRFSKFKYCFENTHNRIESVLKKKFFNNKDDLEILLNPKKTEFNRNNKIYYNDRFFIYPSTMFLNRYHKIKYINITNKIVSFRNDNIVYDASYLGKQQNRFDILEIHKIFEFSYIVEENFIKIREYKVKNEELLGKIEKYERLLEKSNKETSYLEERKARVTMGLNYGEMHRKKLHEYIHNIKGNIRVYCRVKPCSNSDESIIKYPELPSAMVHIKSNEEIPIYNVEIKNNRNNNETSIFNFDKVFTETSSQLEIFLEVKPFIQSALDGENVCIFAYGSTGSGKTFTMQGSYNSTKDNPELINEKCGILPRCAEFIFEETGRLSILGSQFKIYFSAMEIYNENLFDLLVKYNKENTLKKDKNSLNIRQPLNIYTANNDIQIKNLTWVAIENKEDILKFTKEASDSRRCDSTQFNSSSSRSHAIFQIKIDSIKEDSYIESRIINIIDLAGSERSSLQNLGAKTREEIEAVKRIQNEANFINKSLTTLGRIISMIGDRKNAKVAIPYRESKLTMVLQNSLKPNSKTVMIVTVCSDLNNYNMTKESLKFATNAMISC